MRQRAQVAQIHNLLGQKEAIEMRAVEENGSVSYIGSFKFGPPRNLRFVVTATPVVSDEPLSIEFEDRFVVRER